MKNELIDLTNELMAADINKSVVVPEDRRTQAQILIEIAAEADFFHTPEADPYAQVRVDGHSELWSLSSKGFRRWLTGAYYKRIGKPPRKQAFQDAIGVLEARAQFDSPEYALHVRIGEYDNGIYIDLGDVQRRAVEITSNGWRIINDPPVRFRRTRAMKALPEPLMGGSINMLRKFLNLGSDYNWILCLAWLVSAYRPQGPYPILILQGEQGSAKSTTAKLLRRLIDPSVSLIRTPPKDDRDLLIAASNSRIIAYDNLSGIFPWLSDALCRIATGGGLSTRELYTDSEEVFFDAMRPVILNGIDHLAERADLADRAVILNLPPIEESRRKDELQLYAEFERDLPKILGALFSAISGTLARLADTHLDRKPRMADFALWATAAEQPLGFIQGAFMQAYSGNRAEAIQETIESDSMGAAVLMMMETDEQWDGTCKELLQRLEPLVDEGTKRSRDWPKSPRAISGRLRRLATFLRESGIHVIFPVKGAKGRRVLTISRTGGEMIATIATSATQADNSAGAQSVAADQQGGGSGHQLADESGQVTQPPLASPAPGLLKAQGKLPAVAKVAKVAVVSTMDSAPQSSRSAEDPLYQCSNCGHVEWVWNGRAWVCPQCGAPAASQQDRSTDVERFEL